MNEFEFPSVVRRPFPIIPVIVISREFSSVSVPESVLADAFFSKGAYKIPELFECICDLVHELPTRPETGKPNQAAVWVMNNRGTVAVTCSECPRTFPVGGVSKGAMKPHATSVPAWFDSRSLAILFRRPSIRPSLSFPRHEPWDGARSNVTAESLQLHGLNACLPRKRSKTPRVAQSWRITCKSDLLTRMRSPYSMNPRRRKRLRKKLTRDRVQPIIAASVS